MDIKDFNDVIIEEVDKEDMASVLDEIPKHSEEALRLAKDIVPDFKPKSIAVLGMGGSAVSGDFLKLYLEDLKKDIPVYVIRDYRLPKYLNEDTLVFALSYSGNTEETISAYKEAMKLNSHVIAISSGGKLLTLSREKKNTHIRIPSGIQPRLATPYLLFPMFTVLQNMGVIASRNVEFSDALKALKKPEHKQLAKDLAKKIGNRIPVIYASNRFSVIAMKWKTDINENSKISAFYNIYSEFNHNELTGYLNKNADLHVIIIRDDEDHPRIRKRMKITKELFKKYGYPATEMLVKGESYLTKLLSTTLIGLWLSYWLALAYETDPTPVEIIENLKKELG